jgi:hypothetical protein
VGGKVATIDVSGELGPEYNQMLVSGQGPVGATLSWLIATPRIHISDVHPKEVVQGEQVIITGNNLCSDPSVYKVTFNGVAGTVTNATSSQITVTVPSLPAGSCNIQVADFSQTVAAPPIYIKAVPIITGMSIMAGPPGSAFTIYGKGFSADPNEDKVFVSGVQAEVYSASPTQINTCIPTMDYPRPTSVRVQVGNGPESNAWRLLLYNQLY